jgi:stage V sporulation protein SpoVS
MMIENASTYAASVGCLVMHAKGCLGTSIRKRGWIILDKLGSEAFHQAIYALRFTR